MGMAQITDWPSTASYDNRGPAIRFETKLRLFHPLRPFSPGECHWHGKAERIGFNMYRCRRCAARITNERLYHRLLLRRNPFWLPEDGSPWRRLFYREITTWVTR